MSKKQEQLLKLKIQEESDVNRAIDILKGNKPSPATETVIQFAYDNKYDHLR